METEKICPCVKMGGSSLNNPNLNSANYGKSIRTSSHLIACVAVDNSAFPIPSVNSKAGVDVHITAKYDGRYISIDATLDRNVCLATEIIDIITNILLLYDEEYEFALAAEDDVLVDIREIAQQ